MRAALAEAAACQGRRDARGFAVAIVRGLQAGVAAKLAADESMTSWSYDFSRMRIFCAAIWTRFHFVKGWI